ncbi:PIH1 domain-containing protein 2 [Nothobranchius furzeri]|uniref:PIH1 domain-containing protein 2 n=1 Tax=Nothobranchius furzeri TaxID=105023 RepID=A0A1A8UD52_NOTFU|nr:PIH1 domain-containing protein 2 [Nothobranchius furzeri]KAF7218650.1 PIH1 domain containing 2 [Nothobranchius furzeri]
MSSAGRTEDVLQQVNQFWSMLDDLSQNDPAGYHKFIEEQMKKGAEICSPPELHSCIKTPILEPTPGLLYINICSWKSVPAPRDDSSSLPVCTGKLETGTTEAQGWFVVLDVALNPAVLQKNKDKDINYVYKLALNFAQQHHGMQLSQEFSVVRCSPNGSPDQFKCRLGFQKQHYTFKPTQTVSQTPHSLLQQLSSQQSGKQEENPTAQIICRPAERPKKNLIQVISATSVEPQKPEYQLEVKTNTEGVLRSLELTVELPKVRTVSECQLRVSKEDVLLEVADVYHLLLELPVTVNEDTASAVFNKKKQRLVLTVDVL